MIRRVLVANRSEIAIRVFRAATELGIDTIAIYAEEDKLSLHRFKADEAYQVGRGEGRQLGPLESYLSIDEVIRVAKEAGADAIHPGYGLLSESPEFAEACAAAGIIFIGPRPDTMRTLGNKVSARNLAVSCGAPVMPATPPLPDDPEEIKRFAREIGYPVMLKASWGGGGRGMRPIESEETLLDSVAAARREAKSAFGKDEVYLEKLVRRARHVEVQILGDGHGNLRYGERDPGLDPEAIRRISFYWEAVRQQYAAFESDLKSGASEVYLHEMPGGQFTNLKEQARSLGLDTRWHEVARAYRDANDLFGDIVKVTPSSKVVGDMALMMVAQDLTPAAVLDPAREIAFPASVVEMMHGDLGQPPGGWPKALQKKVLKNVEPITERPGALLAEADLAALRAEAEKKCGRQLSEAEFASYLMYPKVFTEFNTLARRYGPVSVLPTPTFFYGMEPGQEITVEIERGKTLVVRLLTLGEADEEGQVKVFFELNGQQRIIKVPNRKLAAKVVSRRKADEGNDAHVAAPMPGLVVTIAVKPGQDIKAGDVIATLEAMKMEMALHAPRDGVVKEVLVNAGQSVDAKDLMVVLD